MCLQLKRKSKKKKSFHYGWSWMELVMSLWAGILFNWLLEKKKRLNWCIRIDRLNMQKKTQKQLEQLEINWPQKTQQNGSPSFGSCVLSQSCERELFQAGCSHSLLMKEEAMSAQSPSRNLPAIYFIPTLAHLLLEHQQLAGARVWSWHPSLPPRTPVAPTPLRPPIHPCSSSPFISQPGHSVFICSSS